MTTGQILFSKIFSSPSKSHTTTNFHKEITHTQEERCLVDPTYKIHPDPMLSSIFVPLFLLLTLSIIKRNTTPPFPYALFATPPHLLQICHPSSQIEHQRTTNGSKINFAFTWYISIHRVYCSIFVVSTKENQCFV